MDFGFFVGLEYLIIVEKTSLQGLGNVIPNRGKGLNKTWQVKGRKITFATQNYIITEFLYYLKKIQMFPRS